MRVKPKNTSLPFNRLSDRVKAVLKQLIIEGGLNPGDKLPTEERIADELQVSKVTVREALRDMETEGLIEKRRGIHGGSFVVEPNCAKISELVVNYIQIGNLTAEHLTEFRRLLEPSLAALATERRSEADIDAIGDCIEAFEASLAAGTVDRTRGIEFHRLIADACHNPLISAVMSAIADVFNDIIAAVPMGLEDGRTDLNYCRQIFDCVVNGNRREASRLMEAHFDVLTGIIRRSRGPSNKSESR